MAGLFLSTVHPRSMAEEDRMMTETMELRTGEELTVKVLHPPLQDYANKVAFWWGDIRSELLEGRMNQWLSTPCFVGEIEGEVAGSMFCFAPANTRDIGIVGFVHTEEKHRQKGVASILLSRLIQRFREDGGLALYLCTNNPIAGSLYEKHGFWYNIGDGMRYFVSDERDFEKEYLNSVERRAFGIDCAIETYGWIY